LSAAPVPPPAPRPPRPPPIPPGPAPPKPPHTGGPPKGWPNNNLSDTGTYYSFNPHATDTRGPKNATRRLMFGWIEGAVSQAVGAKQVPYWQSAHSLMRDVTLAQGTASIVQVPAVGSYEPLRVAPSHLLLTAPIAVSKASAGSYLPQLRGDALEIVASFEAGGATAFGLSLRVAAPHAPAAAFSCNVGFAPAAKAIVTMAAGRVSSPWRANIAPQPVAGQLQLHVFLDRSIIEIYSGGAAFTQRCLLPKGVDGARAVGVDLWAVGGTAKMVRLEAWEMGNMWQPVQTRHTSVQR